MRLLLIAALLVAPVAVSAADLGVPASLLIVVVILAAAWLTVMSGFRSQPKAGEDLVLETITASHFAEKARWCLDRLGVAYVERPAFGTLGAFYLGRTVPRLWVRTDAVWSRIGNSREILRFLWGRYAHTHDAEFLKSSAEREALEKKLDRSGRMLQVWVYHHALDHRELTLTAWGLKDPGVPKWQKWLGQLLFPAQRFLIRRAFGISQQQYERATQVIEDLLGELNDRLADGRQSLSGAAEPDYTDFSFAAMMGLWLRPDGYGGRNGASTRLPDAELPAAMRDDITRWLEDYPKAAAHVRLMYRDYRDQRSST